MGRVPKDGKLIVCWDKKERDIMFRWGKKTNNGRDAKMIHGYFNVDMPCFISKCAESRPTFVEELERRGYDITTLKFSIEKKQNI